MYNPCQITTMAYETWACFRPYLPGMTLLSNDVTFEARPRRYLTWCTALYKSDIPTKIRKCDCESVKYSWVKYFASLHHHTNLHFEDQMKIAKLMAHSICIHYVHTSLHYTAIFTFVKMTLSDEKVYYCFLILLQT